MLLLFWRFEQRSLIFLPHMHLAYVTMATSTINKKQKKRQIETFIAKGMQTSINGNNIHFTEEFSNKFFQGHLKLCFRGPFYTRYFLWCADVNRKNGIN